MADELQGAQQMIEALKDLDAKMEKKILRRGFRAAAKVIRSALIAATPVLTGNLKNSIIMKATKRSRKGPGMIVGWIRSSFGGNKGGPAAFYAGFVNYGHKSGKDKWVSGTEFANKAFESSQSAALAAMTEQMREDFEEEVANARTLRK